MEIINKIKQLTNTDNFNALILINAYGGIKPLAGFKSVEKAQDFLDITKNNNLHLNFDGDTLKTWKELKRISIVNLEEERKNDYPFYEENYKNYYSDISMWSTLGLEINAETLGEDAEPEKEKRVLYGAETELPKQLRGLFNETDDVYGWIDNTSHELRFFVKRPGLSNGTFINEVAFEEEVRNKLKDNGWVPMSVKITPQADPDGSGLVYLAFANAEKNTIEDVGVEDEVDLFQQWETLPENIKNVLEKWQEKTKQGLTYEDCDEFLKDVNAVGYTFEYGMDAEPFNLTKIKEVEADWHNLTDTNKKTLANYIKKSEDLPSIIDVEYRNFNIILTPKTGNSFENKNQVQEEVIKIAKEFFSSGTDIDYDYDFTINEDKGVEGLIFHVFFKQQ